jgi:hypothetical protein
MDWKELPYNHAGKWEKKYESILAPREKVTWPQFIVEMVIYWRKKFIKNYPEIKIGKGWSRPIQTQVRNLEHQASVICNYFPHPDQEPLVIYAVKKYFRTAKPLKLGGFRKNRVAVNKETGRENLTICQAEKDVVLGIKNELDKALAMRNVYQEAKPTEVKSPQNVTFGPAKRPAKKAGLSYLVALEKQLKSEQKPSE